MQRRDWQRVRQVLDTVLHRDRREWPTLVAAACAGDADLQREVEAMLVSHDSAGTFLEAPLGSRPPSSPLTECSDRQVGTYRIEARLGAGGMGEVYRAHDLNLDRAVALKLLTPDVVNDPERLRRFRAEARAASSLNHPNILVIHDFGEFDGQPFIVTELVEGHTLRRQLQAGPIPVREAIDIATQVASALAAAHARGIVHRDIKPENIMLRPDGYVKVLDFGLAKLTTSQVVPSAEASLRTEPGLIMGTPQYMSPEQARGEAVDFRSDQFSFGVVLYELLAGRPPFMSSSRIETAAAVITQEPVPIDRLVTDIPPPLRWAIERCLEKKREARYASTAELHHDLATVHQRISDIQPQTPLPASNLPMTSTALVGRGTDAAAVNALLARDDLRWVTLTGPGGVGKTRLAVHVARESAARFGGAVYFVPLAGVIDASLVPSAIAEALGVRPIGSELAQTALKRVLRSATTTLLLVLDNFEHVAPAALSVTELLDCARGLKVLVTSRGGLHVSVEREYQIAPLVVPAQPQLAKLDALEATPAVALFVDRARAARADFALSPENAESVAAICVTLDGLPLAIELAAAQVKVLSPAALHARLQRKRLSLAGGARDLPARQQALRSAIDWGYELLSPAEQRLFRRLSVFVGGWTIEAAEAVCDAREDLQIDVFDGISALVDKSLVRPVETRAADSRFTMLGTIREYGLERLTDAGELAATRKAHAAYCLVLAEERAANDAAAQLRWLEMCDAEYANLRAALDYVLETGEAGWAMRLATALLPFWQNRAYLIEGRDRLTQALKLGDPAGLSDVRARATFALGTLYWALNQVPLAVTVQLESLEMFRTLGDRRGMAVALNALGIARHLTEPEAATVAFEEALSVWRELGDDAAAARTLSNMAAIALDRGNLEQARALYGEVRAVCEGIGDAPGAAWAINCAGQVEHAGANLEAARALCTDALTRFRSLRDGWGGGDALLALGQIAADDRDWNGAHQLFEQAYGFFNTVGEVRGTVRVIEAFARLAAVSGDAPRALKLAGAAAALRHSFGTPAQRSAREALDRALDEMRQGPGTHESGAAWMEGWGLSVEEAVQYALSRSDANSAW